MLKNDAIYNLSLRFRNINLNNINDIYFAINIVVIATTFFEVFIVIALVFEFVIVIVININIVVVIVIVSLIIVFEKFIPKFIAFGFDIKNCFMMSASFDKPQNIIIVGFFDNVFLRIDDNISLF